MPQKIIYIRPAHRPAVAVPTWGDMPPGFIRIPDPPIGLSREEREQIERLAHRMVKRGYRRRAEDYPIPPWIARSMWKKRYYLARLRYELAIREGFRP